MNVATYKLKNKHRNRLFVVNFVVFVFRCFDPLSGFIFNPNDPTRITSEALIKINTKEPLSLNELILLRFNINTLSPALDLLSSLMIDDPAYFLCTAVLTNDLVSLENFLLIARERLPGLKPLIGAVLFNLNAYYLPLLFENTQSLSLVLLLDSSALVAMYNNAYERCHVPSLNTFWMFHLNMFKQYSRYFFDVLTLSFIYMCSVSDCTMFMITLFNNTHYKNFLFAAKYFDLELVHMYTTLMATHAYLMHLFTLNGTANLNFVNWICLIFCGLFCFEMYYKKNIKGECLGSKLFGRVLEHSTRVCLPKA